MKAVVLRNGSVVKNTCIFCKRFRFHFPTTTSSGSLLPVTPAPGDLITSSDLWAYKHACTQIKIKKKIVSHKTFVRMVGASEMFPLAFFWLS